jgi:hypothetical protein
MLSHETDPQSTGVVEAATTTAIGIESSNNGHRFQLRRLLKRERPLCGERLRMLDEARLIDLVMGASAPDWNRFDPVVVDILDNRR